MIERRNAKQLNLTKLVLCLMSIERDAKCENKYGMNFNPISPMK